MKQLESSFLYQLSLGYSTNGYLVFVLKEFSIASTLFLLINIGEDFAVSMYNGFETVSVIFFTLEYFARLYTADLARKYGKSR